MKSRSCHHRRVKLTTVFEPMDVLDRHERTRGLDVLRLQEYHWEGCWGVYVFSFVGLVLYFVVPFALKKQPMELESCGRTDFTWQLKSTSVKSDGHSWTCLKIRKFFTVNVPYLSKNEEYKWVSYDYSWVKKWDTQMRKKDITDEKLSLNITAIHYLL